MAHGEASVSRTRLELVVLDDFFSSGFSSLLGDDDENMMQVSLWGQMPPDLVEKVLLFLPSFSQGRFHTVCKRWREVMSSPAFQKQALAIAVRRARSYPLGLVHVQLPTASLRARSKEMPPWARDLHQVLHKVPEVDIPEGLVLLSEDDPYTTSIRVFSHGGLVGVAHWDIGYWDLRCWVLSLADQTWQQVPRLCYRKDVITSWDSST